jgi:Zn-dependent peptidase ImmA (M78 family)/DNA-binding XRE family transcriptional regulator
VARRIEAIVNPELLRWARDSAGLDLKEAAERLGMKPETVAAWESAKARPSVAQLQKLASAYRRPLAAFYLPAPPPVFDARKYLRRVAGAAERPPSPDLAFEIREAESRRRIALDLTDPDTADRRSRVPSAGLSDSPAAVAASLRELLGVHVEDQFSWKDDYDALNAWRAAVERLGVLVFQVSGVEPAEMRGFSIFEEELPIVGVNAKDSPRARSFSLLHEVAHLVLGHGDVDRSSRFWLSSDQEETFCNEVAGNALVPEGALAPLTSLRRGARVEAVSPSDVAFLMARFRVSEEVILLRLLRTSRITESLYERRRRALAHYRPKKAEGGPPYYRRVVAMLGRPYVRTVLDAFSRDRITLNDVSDYLGVKLDQLSRVEAAVRLPYTEGAAG